MTQPNFLLITTDQQRADHLGCYGNDRIRTPHIDALATHGRRFDRFYVASGVCMSNRASLMTGRLPSAHGTRCNGIPLSVDATTFVDLLRDAGYATGLVGKCHLQNMTDLPPEVPLAPVADGLRLPGAKHADAIKNRWTHGDYEQEKGAGRARAPYYGFDHMDLCTMHGDMVEGDYRRWLAEQVGDVDAVRGPKNAIPDERYAAPQAYRTRVPEHLYPSAWVGDRAIDFLESVAQGDRPFFLHCSFADPHHPFTPPGRYWDMYDPDDMVLPASFYLSPERHFAPVAALHRERAMGKTRLASTVGFHATEREAKQALALTYGMVTMIDDVVGRVMRRLEALGLDRNTVVIFTSDHGDFMGDHGLILKSALHYQSLVRVPFIWSESRESPSRSGATRALASTLDIGATVLARAGLAPFLGMQGRDLSAVLDGHELAGREAVLIEEDGHAPTFGLPVPVRARTVVTATHRLTIYDQPGWVELYDLSNDPGELHNLAQDPGHATEQLRMYQVLARELMLADDRAPFPTGRA